MLQSVAWSYSGVGLVTWTQLTKGNGAKQKGQTRPSNGNINGYFDQHDELNQKSQATIAAERQECFWSDSVGRTEGDRQQDCLSPAGVLLVAVSLCSGAVLEQVVVGRALLTFRQFFSASLESTTLPTLKHFKNKIPMSL